jgi:hypothetical protein
MWRFSAKKQKFFKDKKFEDRRIIAEPLTKTGKVEITKRVMIVICSASISIVAVLTRRFLCKGMSMNHSCSVFKDMSVQKEGIRHNYQSVSQKKGKTNGLFLQW